MIQFNLLPDVKKDYVKSKRAKRLIVTVSMVSSITAISIVILMYTFLQIAQEKHIKSLTKDIASVASEIQSTEDLNKLLSVQNQLSLLNGLHENKPVTSRVVDYITFVSPKDVKVGELTLTMEGSTINLTGTAESIASINKFADNLKTVTYAIHESDKSERKNPYTGVNTTLSADNESATFDIILTFDKTIFDNKVEIDMFLGGNNGSEEQVITTAPVKDGGQNAN